MAARNVRVIGISADSAAASRKLSARYGIRYSLVHDDALTIARRYVGVDKNDFAVPGVVLIRRGGQIVFRQVAVDKADRIYARRLLAIIDSKLGTQGPRAKGGFAARERTQVRFGLGGLSTVPSEGERAAGLDGSVAVLFPFGPRFYGGGLARFGFGGADRYELGAMLGVRMESLGQLGELYLHVPFGAAARVVGPQGGDGFGVFARAHIGYQYAWYPGLALFVEARGGVRRFSDHPASPELDLGGVGGVVWLR